MFPPEVDEEEEEGELIDNGEPEFITVTEETAVNLENDEEE